jgi:putative heme-binding domain-containing protein
MPLRIFIVSAFFLFWPLASPATELPTIRGLKVPPGFEVTEFAGDEFAHDCYTLTINPKGQVVVAGRGYIRTLIDNGGGKAGRAVGISDTPKDGAMGLLWEGDTLWAVGDGGLRRFTIGPDGKAAGPSELVYKLKTGGEHDAHALRRGLDGWLYLLCGNETGIGSKNAGPLSPIREPVAGAVLRFSPDMQTSEIVADGFRNPYGFDFNGDGELFTFDSDNERCIGLPWYEGCRLYHVIPGGHYGWLAPQRAAFWRLPPYFPDVVPPLADLGRGSPTGVVCHRHRQFPAKYRGGLFLGDWTFGRIYYATLTPSGSTYTAKVETFLESVGELGFAPTGLAVHPTTGDLYVSIGGRGTRGAVYRIRYVAGVQAAAGQRQTSFVRRSLEWNDDLKTALPKRAIAGDDIGRRLALDLLWRHRAHFSEWQMLGIIESCVSSGDRALDIALSHLVASVPQPFTGMRTVSLDKRAGFALGLLAGPYVTNRRDFTLNWVLRFDGQWQEGETVDDQLRFAELAVGDVGASSAIGTVWEGYTPERIIAGDVRRTMLEHIRRWARAGGHARDRERARLFAMLADEDPQTLAKIASKLTEDSDPLDDIHYLICIARLPAPRTPEITSLVKNGLLDLDRKMTARGIVRDTNWPLRMAEVHAELARHDPALNEQLVADPDFARPANVGFTRCPGFDRKRAAKRYYERAKDTPNFPWTPELVALIGELPAEKSRPLLLELWDRGGFEDAILPVLARESRPEDRDKFLAGLRSPHLEQLTLCLTALAKLPAGDQSAELLALVRVLRSLGESKPEKPVRQQVVEGLQKLTGQTIGPDKSAWTAWLTKAHPDLAAKLGGNDGVDVDAWQKRFAGIDWTHGDVNRGKAVFTKASCAACHSGASAIGPDLRGVGGRFGREDLLTSIIQPSKDIAPRYRTLQIETKDGKVHQGLVVYEAPDGLMLQTGPATMVRLAGDKIESRTYTEKSFMPVGLMDNLSDREIADLIAYLHVMK